MDLMSLVTQMNASNAFRQVALNVASQFGTGQRRYLGAALLPERSVEEQAYREDLVRFRTIVANDGTRYSPVQKKGGDLFASFLVELGHSDIGRELSSRDYDALLRLLNTNRSMEAVATMISWADMVLNAALLEHNEKQRWQAIVDAKVERRGDNNYVEDVSYSNPANHRRAELASWSNDATDIFADLFGMADLMSGKGYNVNRIVTSRAVVSIMAGNAKVQSRVGLATIGADGTIAMRAGRATRDAINNVMQQGGLPPIETYDLQYRTSDATEYFLKRDVVVMLGSTGATQEIDLGDSRIELADVLGYTAVGRAAGQSDPGRVVRVEPKENKPPRLEGEAWQTSLPVILEPEAIGVIHTIS
jgi:hypothetical protein